MNNAGQTIAHVWTLDSSIVKNDILKQSIEKGLAHIQKEHEDVVSTMEVLTQFGSNLTKCLIHEELIPKNHPLVLELKQVVYAFAKMKNVTTTGKEKKLRSVLNSKEVMNEIKRLKENLFIAGIDKAANHP